MPDNSFEITVVVKTAEAAAKMDAFVAANKAALDDLGVHFTYAATVNAKAMAKISDDTRAGAASVGDEYKRIAAAQLALSKSTSELAAARKLVFKASDAGDADAELSALSVQAEAIRKNALAQEELAAAKRATMAATTGLAEAEQAEAAGGIEARLVTDTLTGNFSRADQALIRFASHSELIGPIISAAFVPFAVATFVEILARAGEKAYELFQNVFLLRGAIEALEKVDASSGEKAASLHYEDEQSLTRRLQAQGKLNEATAEFAKAAGDKPLEAIKIEDKDVLKQLSKDFVDLINSVHLAKDAPSVLHAIEAEAASATKQLEEHKKLRESLTETPATGDVIADTSSGAGNEFALKQQDKFITDLTHKVSILHNAMSQVQSEMDIDSNNAATKEAENDKKQSKEKEPKDDRMEQWRAELQAKKDAEDGFHELSKADEAAFWESKLALAKGTPKLYAEVNHQVREDERAAQQEGLKDYTAAMQERIAATKAGSAERVALLQEEVGHDKSIGAEETSEYKRAQVELTEAVKAYADEQGKAAIEAERRKVDATHKGSEQRVAAERALLAELQTLGLQETSVYTEQLNRVTEAVREAAQQRVQLQELDIEQARIVGESKLQIERQNVQAEFDLHRISAQQRIAQFKQIENEEYEVAKEAMEKKLALEQSKGSDSSLVEQKRIQNQIENLTREHNNRIAELNTQAAKDSQQKFDQFFSHVNSGFQSAINGWLTGTQTFARSMQQLWHTLVMDIINEVEKIALKWIEQHVLMAAYNAIFHTQEVAQETASTTAKVATQAATNVAMATSDAGLAAAGTFAFYSAIFPPIAPAMAAAAYAEAMGFAGLASAEGGMVSGAEQLAFIHRNEMVLPAALSKGISGMIANGSSPGAASADQGRGTTNHSIQYNGDTHISAFDSKGVADMIKRNQREFTRAAAGIVRNGWRPK